jgi:hypothetical protein
MPNRILKESICTSEDIDGLSWFEESMFYRLITACDDFGRMDARPAVLKARLFPLKEGVTKNMVEKAIQSMERIGMLKTYMIDGHRFLKIVSWSKHQRMRTSKEKYPGLCDDSPQDAASCGELPRVAEDCGSRARPCAGAESESNPNPNPNPNTNTKRARAAACHAFGRFKNVQLTDEEYEKLGPTAANDVESLSLFMASKGKTYENHYATILNWRRRDKERGSPKPGGNFTPREYTDEELNGMYEEVQP